MDAYWTRTRRATLAAVEVSPDDYAAILPEIPLRRPLGTHGHQLRTVDGVVLVIGNVQLRAVATVANGKPRTVPASRHFLGFGGNPWASVYRTMSAAHSRLVIS